MKSTLAQPKSKPLKKPYTLTLVDIDILKAVWFHHFITAEQLLRHRDRSLNGLAKMQEKLKFLLEKSEPRVSLFDGWHEWMLRQEIYRVTLYRETQSQRVREEVRFTPDGWLDFRITSNNQTQQACILLEMDMDTHQKPRFQKKIASYVAFINEGLYEQQFHTTSVVIAFVTPTGDKRAMQMKAWCEEQLVQSPVYRPSRQAANSRDDAGLFLFGAIPSGALSPSDVFLSPLWLAPFDNQPQALLVI